MLTLLLAGLVGPAAAVADDLSLTPSNFNADGVPATVTASGSSTTNSQGRVSVFRVVSQGSGCPGYSSAYSQGVQLGSEHSLNGPGSFSFEEQNSGTQTPGTTYRLCGYLDTMSGTTVAATAPYTVPGGGPPPGTPPPAATTGGVGGFGAPGTVVTGTVTPNGYDTNFRFEYGPTTAYGQSVEGPGAVGGTVTKPQDVYVTIPPQPAGTTLHYRLVVTNAAGTGTGNDRVFTTPGGTPTVKTGSAGNVTYKGFTLNGLYNPHGYTPAMFEYTLAPMGSNRVLQAAVPPVDNDNAGADNAVSVALPLGFVDYYVDRWPTKAFLGATFPEVQPTSTIMYRLVAGESKGEWKSVTSPAPTQPPAVTTGAASVQRCEGSRCIVFEGTIDGRGQGSPFSAFEVGPTKSYGILCRSRTNESGGDGTGPREVYTVNCSDPFFPAGTTLHYRLGASLGGSSGVAWGADRTFKVPGKPSGLEGDLAAKGPDAYIDALLKNGAYETDSLYAPGPGVVSLNWYYQPPGARSARAKPVQIASGQTKVKARGQLTVTVKPTAAGKALLRKVKPGGKLKVTVEGSFDPAGEAAKVTREKTFTLRREFT